MASFVEHMGVNYGCLNVLVPEQFLHGADIIAAFEQVGSEGVAEGMASDGLVAPCQTSRPPSD